MLKLTTVILFLTCTLMLNAQFEYDASPEFPYGRANPEAPEQMKDYADLIGECKCKSTLRNQDGTWAEPVDMIWRFKYIMNGFGVQDETLKADGAHSGSIRQYSTEDGNWRVHFYANKSSAPTLPTWEGKKTEGKMVLYREQKAPNDMDGFYKLTFYDISEAGYKWIGEWVNKDESIVYPTWKIDCKR